MSDRGKEIEAFFWMLMRLGVMAFGYLMIAGGGLMALTFALEKLRTGQVAFGGQMHVGTLAALKLVVIPLLVAAVGFVAVRKMRDWKKDQSPERP